MTQSITELEALKSRLKATWMSGDFDKIAQLIEPGAISFIERLSLVPGTRVLDEDGQAALKRALTQLWSEHNLATDAATHVEAEYVEVVATRV